MDPQYQAELDALVQRPGYKKHGMWHKAPDVVENVKLANMLYNEWIMEEDIACILMLSSVITCPSMTSLFCNLLESALLRTDDHPRDAALDIMAQFHERGLPAIAKQEIEAFTINSWRDIPNALHIDRVVSGFRSNRDKIIKFCKKLAAATKDRSLFNERAVFDDLHNKLSKCGGGYGDYQAGRFLRLWLHTHGQDEPPSRTTPTVMADGLYEKLPSHLRNGMPTVMSPFQFAFLLCMASKPVRHIDRNMYGALFWAYHKPDLRFSAAAQANDAATQSGQVSPRKEYDACTRSIEKRPVGPLPPMPAAQASMGKRAVVASLESYHRTTVAGLVPFVKRKRDADDDDADNAPVEVVVTEGDRHPARALKKARSIEGGRSVGRLPTLSANHYAPNGGHKRKRDADDDDTDDAPVDVVVTEGDRHPARSDDGSDDDTTQPPPVPLADIAATDHDEGEGCDAGEEDAKAYKARARTYADVRRSLRAPRGAVHAPTRIYDPRRPEYDSCTRSIRERPVCPPPPCQRHRHRATAPPMARPSLACGLNFSERLMTTRTGSGKGDG